MQNLEDYTPEMLVFYQNLPAPVQNAVRHADVELEDLDSLAVFAEIWPSCTTADAERRAEHAFG